MLPADVQELARAASSPWAFLTEFGFTQDPRLGVAHFPRFAYVQDLLRVVERERYTLVPKSRQMLVTWTMVGYFLWRALFRGPGVFLFLSRNERCAEELLERARFILAELPPAFQPRRTANSREELGFGPLGSRILSLPASPHGPRMYSPSGVFWDEMAFTPYDEQIWTALKPALDSGGRFVGVSSSNGPHNQFARFVASGLGSPPTSSGGAGGCASSRIGDSRFAARGALTPPESDLGSPPTSSGGAGGCASSRIGESRFAARGALTPPESDLGSPPTLWGDQGGSASSRIGESRFAARGALTPPVSDFAARGALTPPESGSLFHIHRIHYSLHPERDHAWKRQAGAGLSQARWNQEQEISFESATDLVYHEFDPVRHLLPRDWRVNPMEPVYRTIDFGYRHPFVLWIQRLPEGDVIVFDEWAGRDATTEQMLHAIRAIDLKHGLREVDVHWTSCDPAGAAVQDSGLSPVDSLSRAGVKLRYRSSRLLPGIERVKSAFVDATGRTSLYVTQNCARLISDLYNYRWAPGGDEPLKDGESDHSLDALRYFFVNLETPDDLLPLVRMAGSRW